MRDNEKLSGIQFSTLIVVELLDPKDKKKYNSTDEVYVNFYSHDTAHSRCCDYKNSVKLVYISVHYSGMSGHPCRTTIVL